MNLLSFVLHEYDENYTENPYQASYSLVTNTLDSEVLHEHSAKTLSQIFTTLEIGKPSRAYRLNASSKVPKDENNTKKNLRKRK